ncbi:MAG TPA: type II toxin-antitoxin system RatA family toxin [Rubrivivax sp.]|nr:type II toxin-antitoxin system RatA family toxin [Rubrivivax sp.]
MEARRSVLVAHPAERMFDLIEAAEFYPAFLPWCASAVVLQRDDAVVVARLQVAYLGARFEFTTRNPKRRPEFMAIGLEEGPFRRFEGSWHLKPLSSWGCRIEFALSYDFTSSVMGSLASPVFHRIADTMVDAFIQRADSVYGDTPAAGLQSAPELPRPATPAAPEPPALQPATPAPPPSPESPPGPSAPPQEPPSGAEPP